MGATSIIDREDKLAVGEIINGVTVAQSFVASRNYLSGISIPIATYRRRIESTLVFRLYESDARDASRCPADFRTRTIRAQTTVDTSLLYDHDDFDFRFPRIDDAEGRFFWLTISSTDGCYGQAVSVWFCPLPQPEPGSISFVIDKANPDRPARRTEHWPGFGLICTPRYSQPVTQSRFPRAFLWSPWTSCNANCVHCISSWTRSSSSLIPSSTRDQVREICAAGQVDNLMTDFSGDIFYTDSRFGGELDFLLDLDVVLFISTNGAFMTRDRIIKLLEHGRPKSINISLDAATPRVFRSLRRWNTPLEAVLENIRALTSLRAGFGAEHVEVTISFVLMKRNLHEFIEAIDIAQRLGVDRVLGHHLQVYSGRMEKESLFRHQSSYNEQWPRILEYAREKGVEVRIPRPFHDREVREGHMHCPYPWESLGLLGNGMATACCVTTMTVGDLRKSSIEEIWNGEAFQDLRGRVNSTDPPRPCRHCPVLGFDNNPSRYLFNRVRPDPGGWRRAVSRQCCPV